MSFFTEAMKELGVTDYVVDGEQPTTEAEFTSRFQLITGKTSEGLAILSSDLSSMSVSWSDISAKMTELSNAEPMKKLREERDKRLADTDFWALSDRTMTDEQKSYRQALRNITNLYNSLDDVVWPEKP